MSELEITITGPTGSGKTTLAGWLWNHLYGRATGTSEIRLIDEDNDRRLTPRQCDDLLSGVLRNKDVTIRTVQVSQKAWAERGEVTDSVPPRDCPECDYSLEEHRLLGSTSALDLDCSLTQEDLR